MAKPILRWIGTKRNQAAGLARQMFTAMAPGGRYFEPFLGSASVALALVGLGVPAANMVLADRLDTLIETYQALTLYPEQTIELYGQLGARATTPATKRRIYGALRASLNEARRQGALAGTPRPPLAAAFLYVNARGFNGVVRQNKSGDFNMSIGEVAAGRARLCTSEELASFALALRGALLWHADFERVIDQATAGDLIYCDPPYDGTWTGYSTEWAENDQRRLASALRAAHRRGATIFASNANTERIRGLYAWCEIIDREVYYQVAQKPSQRGYRGEVLLIARSGYSGNAEVRSGPT